MPGLVAHKHSLAAPLCPGWPLEACSERLEARFGYSHVLWGYLMLVPLGLSCSPRLGSLRAALLAQLRWSPGTR